MNPKWTRSSTDTNTHTDTDTDTNADTDYGVRIEPVALFALRGNMFIQIVSVPGHLLCITLLFGLAVRDSLCLY